jgi:formyltetrahydrofolate synthetase
MALKPRSSLEIAQEAELRPIVEIAKGVGLVDDEIELYGRHKAKIDLSVLDRLAGVPDGKLICTTALTPTKAGKGKTTTSVSLTQGLGAIGKRPVLCLREASVGPVFGIKGGAAGGGYAQVVPMDDLNLHFTGDIHAIGAANNLLAAILDTHILHGNALRVDPLAIGWRRCVDINDRALRDVVVGLGGSANGYTRQTGLDITAASELGDYVVTDAGFGSDMGMEKFLNIVCRAGGLSPSAIVLVVTVRLKHHGGDPEGGPEAIERGAANLARHLAIVAGFGLKAVVAINRFPGDTPEELERVRRLALELGAQAAEVNEAFFEQGGPGAAALAEAVVDATQTARAFEHTYPLDASIEYKIAAICTRIYGADSVIFLQTAKDKIARYQAAGLNGPPICMAKTHLSLSHDPQLLNAPTGFEVTVRDVRAYTGAGWLVPLCGTMQTMPGLGASAAAFQVDIDGSGRTVGLF